MNPTQQNELENIIAKNYNNMTGLIIFKDNQLLYENYFQHCHAQSSIHIYSVTKSIISILIGIAIDQGYIQSVHQPLSDFFPPTFLTTNNH